jgi:rod shape-determining protein MreD
MRGTARRIEISAYLYLPLLAVVALLQVTLAPYIQVLGAHPDFMFLTVIAWGLLRGTRTGIVWGFVGGLFISFFSGGPFGVACLALMAVGFIAGLGQTTVTRGQIALPVLTALLTALVHGLLSLLLLDVSGYPVAWLDTIARVLLPTMVFNALLTVPVYAAYRRLHRATGREELEW